MRSPPTMEQERTRRRGPNREIVKAGDYVFGTARVLHRRYLLKPDRKMMNALRWIFGHYSRVHGIEILALCVMSTHYHIVLRDVRGVNPNFFRDVNRSIANVLKARYRLSGQVFEQKPNKTVLHSAKAVADKIGYTLANPIAAGAVREPHEWPGLRTRLDDLGKTVIVGLRPDAYFGKRKTMPEQASFEVREPTWLIEELGREGAAEELRDALERNVQEARAAVRERGWKYLGAERATKVDPFNCAKAYEVFGSRVPHLSTFGLTREEAIAIKQDYVAWQLRYDDCRERLLRGETNILWPPGTWAMVQFFGQRAEPLANAA